MRTCSTCNYSRLIQCFHVNSLEYQQHPSHLERTRSKTSEFIKMNKNLLKWRETVQTEFKIKNQDLHFQIWRNTCDLHTMRQPCPDYFFLQWILTSVNCLNVRLCYASYMDIIIVSFKRDAEKTFIWLYLCIMWLDLEWANVSLQFVTCTLILISCTCLLCWCYPDQKC